MFTGIVEELGSINSISQKGSSLELNVNASFAPELEEGESVAVNGTCLTVTRKTSSSFCADVTPESFRRTSLGQLTAGSIVNLERAMKADGRFGGHIVSGHIDGTGKIIKAVHEENAVNVFVLVNNKLGRYIIEKGSVAVDGISLTVASVAKDADEILFSVAVIPHTWKNTTLCKKNSGDMVNIECDVVGKYVEHFLHIGNQTSADEEAQNALDDFMSSFTSFH